MRNLKEEKRYQQAAGWESCGVQSDQFKSKKPKITKNSLFILRICPLEPPTTLKNEAASFWAQTDKNWFRWWIEKVKNFRISHSGIRWSTHQKSSFKARACKENSETSNSMTDLQQKHSCPPASETTSLPPKDLVPKPNLICLYRSPQDGFSRDTPEEASVVISTNSVMEPGEKHNFKKNLYYWKRRIWPWLITFLKEEMWAESRQSSLGLFKIWTTWNKIENT